MAFNISYIFTAKDKFSAPAKKVVNANNAIKRSAQGAQRSLLKKNTALRKLKASLIIARRKLRDYNRESKKTSTVSANLIGKFKQIAALAIVGLGISKIIRDGSRLEDALADLSAITGTTGKDLNFLKGEVTALSVESRTLPAEVATAFKAVASAKSELLKDPKALSEVTKQVLLLKNAAGIDMAQAVNAVTLSLNIFGAAANQAGRFVNVLAAGAKVGASEVFETKEAIVTAGVAAKLAGLSFESFNALIQVMAKSGIKGARSGTELTALLIKMEAKMGKLAPSVIGINESLGVLEKMNLSAGDAMKMFGLESVDVLDILTSNIPLLKQWTKEVTGTSEAQIQANIRMSTFSSLMQGSKVKLINLTAAIFNSARPALVSLGSTLDKFISGLDPSDVEAFGLVLSGLGRIAQFVAEIIGTAFKILMLGLKPVLAVLNAIGEIIGQVAAAIATLDFSKFKLGGLFELGGKFLGLFGGDEESAEAAISAAIADKEVALNLVPPETIPNQETILTVVAPTIPDQEVALNLVPSAGLSAQEAAINIQSANAVTAAEAPIAASPAVATANANATVNGQINVSASPGSQIDSVTQEAFRGSQGNIGLGVAAQ